MFEAQSMYLGGVLVSASEELSYSDYIKYGFRCIVCGEDVFLRKPYNRQPHFVHHHYSENTSEKCSLRISQFATNSSVLKQINWETRGQRREIYQKHLLDIIAQTHLDFYQTSEEIFFKFPQETLIYICHLFQTKRYRFLTHLTLNNKSSTLKEKTQIAITKEVIDYLCIEPSLDILKVIIAYSISKIDTNLDPRYAVIKAKRILLTTNWLDSLYSMLKPSHGPCEEPKKGYFRERKNSYPNGVVEVIKKGKGKKKSKPKPKPKLKKKGTKKNKRKWKNDIKQNYSKQEQKYYYS